MQIDSAVNKKIYVQITRGITIGGVLLALAGLETTSAAAALVQGTVVVESYGSSQTTGTGKATSLAAILDRLDWDPATQGALLIVAPAKTELLSDTTAAPNGFYIPGRKRELKPPGPRGYRLTVIDADFGRKVTPLGTLTALVPTTMVVLHDRNLPAPDPYTGLSQDQREQLFFSLLTPAQWNRLTQLGGIGVSDLNADQRRLFLGLLPDPFVVTATQPGGGPNGQPAFERVTLTPAQVRTIRITLQPTMSWSFTLNEDSNHRIGIGVGNVSNTRPTLSLAPNVQTMMTSIMSQRELLYGVRLREEVPNRAKAGHLNFEAAALAKRVSLSGATTVGDLVQRVAATSGLELYADRRYQDLPVYVRGDSARAGDILKALTLSVSGTIRRVQAGKENAAGQTAYVLTDDLEGLAQRHARIRSWIRVAHAQVSATLQEAEARLKALQGEPKNVVWNAGIDDSMLPDGALRRKIDAHLEKLRNYPTWQPGERRSPEAWRQREQGKDLWIPVSELPAEAREMVQKQISSYRPGSLGGKERTLRTDAVRLDVQMTSAYVIPGMGRVTAQGMRTGGRDSLFDQASRQSENAARTDAAEEAAAREQLQVERKRLPLTLPGGNSTRALLIAVKDVVEARRAAIEAHTRGLNQLWLAVSPDSSPDSLKEQVEAAKKAAPGLKVFALVRVLRLPRDSQQGEATREADRNVLGETLTEYVARRTREAKSAPQVAPVNPAGNPFDIFAREGSFGDLARCDVPEENARLIARVTALARTPGLDGLAVRDLVAPGYLARSISGVYTMTRDQEPDAEFGYDPELRLAFLRKYGCDPIDLLKSGDQSAMLNLPVAASMMFFSNPNLELPLFRDFGQQARGSTVNGVSNITLGAGDANEQWPRFLYETGAAFQNMLFRSLEKTLAPGAATSNVAGKSAPAASVRLLREMSPDWAFNPAGTEQRYVPWNKPVESTLPALTPTPPTEARTSANATVMPEPMIRSIRYEAQEQVAWYSQVPPPERYALQVAHLLNQRPGGNRQPAQTEPNNFVLDLSDRPLADALTLLTQLRAPAPAN